jgi:hypothetical protein
VAEGFNGLSPVVFCAVGRPRQASGAPLFLTPPEVAPLLLLRPAYLRPLHARLLAHPEGCRGFLLPARVVRSANQVNGKRLCGGRRGLTDVVLVTWPLGDHALAAVVAGAGAGLAALVHYGAPGGPRAAPDQHGGWSPTRGLAGGVDPPHTRLGCHMTLIAGR